ncbi:MAG: phosphate/phosphite/phosphonate ABC transporter substrate-binding protein [Leptospiraceae bacterium]|nr:phosphate/phosphite/phosphonate ABC transporter substrate-binding protein [Leptospiraceae bacterium]
MVSLMHIRIICLLCLTLISCQRDTTADIANLAAGKKEEVYGEIDTAPKTELNETAYARSINFGVTPWGDIDKMRKAYQPLANYLSEKLNARVRLMIVQEYRELVSDLKRGIVQIASFSPGAYADALDEGIEKDSIYIASAQLKGKDYYRGIIVARNEVKDLAALKNKTFAFVETGSSSGYKYPLALFLANRIDPHKYFSKVYFLGSHPNVVDAVINGKVDAGATWDGYIEENFPTNPPNIKVLLKTEPIPYDAVVVSRRKGADLAGKLREILTGLKAYTVTKSGEKILNLDTGFPYSGYVVHSQSIYNIVRKTGKAVGRYRKTEKAE